LISNATVNIVGDSFPVLVKKYFNKMVIKKSINFYITPNGQTISSTAYRAIGGTPIF